MENLKRLLYDLFDNYDEYEDIRDCLRSLESNNKITEQEYDIILDNYDKWLADYQKNNWWKRRKMVWGVE